MQLEPSAIISLVLLLAFGLWWLSKQLPRQHQHPHLPTPQEEPSVAARVPATPPTVAPSLPELVSGMREAGLDSARIAATLHISQGEVELLLALHRADASPAPLHTLV